MWIVLGIKPAVCMISVSKIIIIWFFLDDIDLLTNIVQKSRNQVTCYDGCFLKLFIQQNFEYVGRMRVNCFLLKLGPQ